MRILLTGAGGFVGKRLTKCLAEQGHHVTAAVRSLPPPQDEHYYASENVEILPLELTSIDFLSLPAEVDVLYTLAQSSHFREFPEKATDVFMVNITANFLLWHWAMQTGVRRCIHISSGGIYGGRSGEASGEDESLAIDSPLGFYASSKLCSEIIFQNYKAFFDTAVILRPFFIYGPGQREDMLIPRLINAVKQGKPIQLQGERGLRINPIFVMDAIVAFANALHLKGCHILNVAGPEVLYLRQIGDIIGEVLGKLPEYEMQPGEPVDYIGDTQQASNRLNQPMTPFRAGLSKTLLHET